MTHRLLVTGSRNWTDVDLINRVLASTWHQWGRPADATLVVGRARDGADAIAERIWREHGLPVDPFPADWSQGKHAGFDRNGRMVASGADVCAAFVAPCIKRGCPNRRPHGSHGTLDCMHKARAAGIRVVPFYSHLELRALPDDTPVLSPRR